MKSILLILALALPLFAAPPDIVLIMSDDMGISDLGCYGGEIETPQLDALAAGGLRFTNFYSENMCMSSRAALQTGRYTYAVYRNKRLVKDCATIGEVLGPAGYATRMSGKWHLGPVDAIDTFPTRRGYQQYYGTIYGAGSFFAPAALFRNEENIEQKTWQNNPDYYYTDAISDEAVRFIEDAPQGQPLLLNVAYTAAHWPLHAFPKDIEKYKGHYAQGWDALRAERFAKMKQLGILDANTRLSPRHPDVPAWETETHKAWQERRMEVYAAQVDVMDRGIGRIVDALKKNGRYNNTLILFMIDNGGCHVEYGAHRKGPYLPQQTRAGKPMKPGNLPGLMPGPENTYQSYGYGWANASNTPYRLFKQHAHAGGIRTPLIVHWPGKTAKGALVKEPAHLIDILPTLCEITGATLPADLPAMHGKSLAGVFAGKSRDPHDMLFFRWAKGKAVRSAEWKLVRENKKPWELYRIDQDPTELNNLAAAHPDRVKQLEQAWLNWDKEMQP